MKKLLIKKFDQFTIEEIYLSTIPKSLPSNIVRGIAFAAYFFSKNYSKYNLEYSYKDILIDLLGQNITFSKTSSVLNYNNKYTTFSMVGKVKEYVFYFDVIKEKEYVDQIKVSLPKTNTHLIIHIHETKRNKNI